MQVDFIIIGAQKCGTTTLYDILASHPGLVGSRPKEPHFFQSAAWRERVDQYHALFEQQPGVRYFEASTSYTFYPLRRQGVWNDLFEYNPELKFIYLVRNPVERVISNYLHDYERSSRAMDIDEEVPRNRGYIETSRYYTQVMPFIRRFGRDRVLLIDFDDFIQRRAEVLDDISAFLGIDSEGFRDFEAVHSNAAGSEQVIQRRYFQPPLHLKVVRRYLPWLWRRITDNSDRLLTERPVPSAETVELIGNMLELEIAGIEELLGKDLSAWRTHEVPT